MRFRIVPKLKVRSEGQVVHLKDQILLMPEGDTSRFLHIMANTGSGNPWEMNCSFTPMAWLFKMYDETNVEPEAIRVGAPIALFHAEVGGFLSSKAFEPMPPPTKKCNQSTERATRSSMLVVHPKHASSEEGSSTQIQSLQDYDAMPAERSDSSLASGFHTARLTTPRGRAPWSRTHNQSSTTSLMDSSMDFGGTVGSFRRAATFRKPVIAQEGSRLIDKFLQGLKHGPKTVEPNELTYLQHVDTTQTSYSVEELEVLSNSLWMLENRNPTLGGPAKFNTAYRLKHMATKQYLGVIAHDHKFKWVLFDNVTDYPTDTGLFTFLPFDSDQVYLRTSECYFNIQQVSTRLYLHFIPQQTGSSVKCVGGYHL